MNSEIVPFGKYSGQPIESMLADSDYVRWVKAQPGIMAMLEIKHQVIFNIITVGGHLIDDTPEHNTLQARFLDQDFQFAFIEIMTNRSVSDHFDDGLKSINAMNLADWEKRRAEALARFNWLASAKIELENCAIPPEPVIEGWYDILYDFECGFDVLLTFKVKGGVYFRWEIEIKPLMGDDFPSVLRQMKRNRAQVLVVDKFQSRACNLSQVRAIFGQIKIVMVEEIDELIHSR